MANKYTDAVFHARLTGIRKLVLWVLAQRADGDTGVCWPSYTRIAKDAGIGEQTAKDAVKFLLAAGLVTVVGKVPVRDTQLSTNKYELQLDEIVALATSDKYAFKSQTRYGSRTSMGDEPVREPSQLGTGAVHNSVREPLELGTGDDRKYFSNTPLNNTSTNTEINYSISHRSNSQSYSADAENLSLLFHSLLESNPNVKFIQKNWQHIFPVDIEKLVEAYGPDWAEKIIRVSQTTSWNKYIIRSATLVEKAQEMYQLALKLDRKQTERPASYPQSEEAEFGEAETFETVPVDDEEDFG